MSHTFHGRNRCANIHTRGFFSATGTYSRRPSANLASGSIIESLLRLCPWP